MDPESHGKRNRFENTVLIQFFVENYREISVLKNYRDISVLNLLTVNG